jgi:hypothetical protein
MGKPSVPFISVSTKVSEFSGDMVIFTKMAIKLADAMIAEDARNPEDDEHYSIADLMEQVCSQYSFIATDMPLYKRIAEAGEAIYKIHVRYLKVPSHKVEFR